MVHRVWDELRQYECARNPGFYAEISRLAHLGLQVVGAVALAFAVIMILVTAVVSNERLPTGAYWAMGGVMAAGLAIIAVSKTGWARPRASAIGLGGTFVIATFQIWFSLLRSAVIPGADRYIVTQAAVFLLVALVSLPLHPMQILGLGVSITGTYALSAYYAVKWARVADSGALPWGYCSSFSSRC